MSGDIGNGPPSGDNPDATAVDGGGAADAAPIADAPLPDARACVEGDRRVEGADGTCFFGFDTPQTWPQARATCQGAGGDLVRIDDGLENDLVFALARQSPQIDDDWWTGANDRLSEGTWVWQDDTGVIVQCDAASPPNCTAGTLFQQFRSGEPNNGTANGEDCMIVETDTAGQTWDDRNCDGQVYPYICEHAQ